MLKKLAIFIVLLAGLAILLQVPVVSDFTDGFKADITEKVDNIKGEVDRVKDKVETTKKNIEEIGEKIEETKENISAFAKWMQETKDQIGKAVNSIQSMVDKLTSLFTNPDSEDTPAP